MNLRGTIILTKRRIVMKKALMLFLTILLIGGNLLKPCEIHHNMDQCWMEDKGFDPDGTGLGEE